ncbi:DUF3703 domain-containing protein [Nonomuraea basaltis]|uniref:DUF3703 domain-containing protein n=1 Tax=Nonomuraea basaltis TaxID=2495887 RepID=UPI001F0E54BE|nr:DUF3703 domain-containing protein [Nonomuraea basaltis]
MPAHIISQPWPWPHTANHLAMFALAVRRRDRREAIGQVVRIIVAAPGSALGRYPEGNMGLERVRSAQPMPVPADLAAPPRRARPSAGGRRDTHPRALEPPQLYAALVDAVALGHAHPGGFDRLALSLPDKVDGRDTC